VCECTHVVGVCVLCMCVYECVRACVCCKRVCCFQDLNIFPFHKPRGISLKPKLIVKVISCISNGTFMLLSFFLFLSHTHTLSLSLSHTLTHIDARTRERTISLLGIRASVHHTHTHTSLMWHQCLKMDSKFSPQLSD
jgi:hypothetical protein